MPKPACAWCGQPATIRLRVGSYDTNGNPRAVVTEWCETDVGKVRTGLLVRKAMGETIVVIEETL